VFRRVDTISGAAALALHAGIALAMLSVAPRPPRASTLVEVDVRRMPPPPRIETPPEPLPPPPEPERKVVPKVKVAPPPEATPPPNKTPPAEPPKEVKPVFGVTMDSTTDSDSSFSVPVGNTTMIDPKNSGKHTGVVPPLPIGTPGATPKPEYKPVADVYIKTLPEIDGEACARLVSYPAEAEQLGIEGEVKLRVSLDETGKVHDIKVLAGLGHGLDQAAISALRNKCKFKPAVGTDGKPVAYVIQTYTWTFELPR
jgi:protein TonB